MRSLQLLSLLPVTIAAAIRLHSAEIPAARILEGHTGSVLGTEFSPDGATLVTSSRDHSIKVWNAKTGELMRTLTAHKKDVFDVVYSARGDLLASASAD